MRLCSSTFCYFTETYDKYKAIPPQPVVMETAQKTLLPKEEVVMWFEHLHQIAENRRAGAKKAAATRREKRCTKTVSSCNSGSTGKTTVSAVFDKHDPKELCQECGRTDLPDRELDTASWMRWLSSMVAHVLS